MAGDVVTMDGLVLLAQEATGRFETWRMPGRRRSSGWGAGGGCWGGARPRRPGRQRWAAGWGRLAAFMVLAAFFELVIGIDGRRYVPVGRYGVAALLIVAGLVLLGCRLLTATRR